MLSSYPVLWPERAGGAAACGWGTGNVAGGQRYVLRIARCVAGNQANSGGEQRRGASFTEARASSRASIGSCSATITRRISSSEVTLGGARAPAGTSYDLTLLCVGTNEQTATKETDQRLRRGRYCLRFGFGPTLVIPSPADESNPRREHMRCSKALHFLANRIIRIPSRGHC